MWMTLNWCKLACLGGNNGKPNEDDDDDEDSDGIVAH